MFVVSVERVEQLAAPPGLLWGGFLDQPREGSRHQAAAVEMAGWVLGRGHRAVAVEIREAGRRLSYAPILISRPDVAAAHPHLEGASRCGFSAVADLAGNEATATLDLLAVLANRRRVPVARVALRRSWFELEASGGRDLVSLVVTCHGHGGALGDAIASVVAQTYRRLEILVVYDETCAEANAIAEQFPGVRVIRQPRGGVAEARNAGLRESRGAFVTFLGAEDRLLPGALGVGVGLLRERAECAFAAGRSIPLATEPAAQEPPSRLECGEQAYRRLLRAGLPERSATTLYRRGALRAVRGFERVAEPSADYALQLRISRDHPTLLHDAPVALHREPADGGDPAAMLAALWALRREAAYCRRDPERRRAWRQGLRSWRHACGQRLGAQVVALARAHRWGRLGRLLWALLRHHPSTFLALARRPSPTPRHPQKP
ncbi:MAG TPA: glycosyltransferase family 2 protein [Thermoanaerobaculia bacterium]|nr:glycosyltransferase family 2 protein [Thermoanaerobaculia bacterium]